MMLHHRVILSVQIWFCKLCYLSIAMSDADCSICLQPLIEAGQDVLTLDCAHSFHKECMMTYCATTGIQLADVKCPYCKQTAADVAALPPPEVAALPPPEVVSGGEPPVAESGDVPMVDLGSSSSSESQAAELQAGARGAQTHPSFEAPSVFCSYCGSQAALHKARLTAKGSGRWQCNLCNTRLVQLHRGFGTWPTNEFKSLSDEDQQAFMRSLGAGSSSSTKGFNVVAQAKEYLRAHEVHEQFYESSGEFLPLSVWQCRGFDSAAIESGSAPEDLQRHPVLGPVYRVKTLKLGSRGSEGNSRSTDVMAKKPKMTIKAILAAAPQPQAVPQEDAQSPIEVDAEDDDDQADDSNKGSSEEDGSDSDSASSSSSVVSRKKSKKSKGKKNKQNKKHKKSKKNKKAKKSKKQQLKDEKEQKDKNAKKAQEDEAKRLEKEKKKQDQAALRASAAKEKANTTLAQQILTKVNGPISTLAVTMAKAENSGDLPSFVADAARCHMANLQNVMRQAERVLNDNSRSMTVQTIKEVTKMCSDAKKTEVLMNQMLTTVGKIRG